MDYGVSVTNKFQFLSDDETEDPFESLAKAEAAKKDKPALSKKDKKAAAVVAKPIIAPPPKAEPEKQQRQANKENIDRGGARGPRGGRGRVNFAERKDAGNRPAADSNHDVMGDRFGENRPPRGGGRGGGRGGDRGGFRGGDRGGFRGRPRSDNPDSGFRSGGESEDVDRPRGGGGFRSRGGPRRGFAARGDRHTGGDRHSGSDRTGVRPFPKKEGFGKGNWGTENDELVGETEPVPPVSDTETQKAEDRPVGEEGAQEPGQEEKKEEEEDKTKELTLEEWKALHGKKEEHNFNVRKAGEGQDPKIYKNLVPLKKDEEVEEHEEVIIVRREPREKPLNIEVNFSDASRQRPERSFRGGRGGDREEFRGGRGSGGDRRDYRGGRSGGGGRGGRRENFALNDEAFPALGK